MKTFRIVALLSAITALTTACGVEDAEMELGGEETLAIDEGAVSTGTRFEIFAGKDGQSYFHLIAGNGQKVLSSEGYASATGAKSGIATVKTNGVVESRYLLRESSDGRYYFVLVAGNGQIIGISQMYTTAASAKAGITATMKVVTATANQPLPATSGTRFESFKGLDGRYYFHLRAANGQIILQSQGYASAASASSGIASVKTNGLNADRFQTREAADGKTYFVLKASNGQIIGVGETYDSQSNAQRGITTVIDNVSSLVRSGAN
jgi:uncharacterized protein YegP (UPF0339 family)